MDILDWEDQNNVSDDEFAAAIRRVGNVAPGPDGITGNILKLAAPHIGHRFMACFNRCLKEGIFPQKWKMVRLVLLKKPSCPDGAASFYRPICLLNETAKLFERILAKRIQEHLVNHGPDLSEFQYGFRPKRSTIDAVLKFREITDHAVSRKKTVIAVSFDIKNAFNSLPWKAIKEAMKKRNFSRYIRAVTADYLHRKYLVFVGPAGTKQSRRVVCGVPQGSVLGPILWDLAYDEILKIRLPPRCSLICYADDTLFVTTGQDIDRAISMATIGAQIFMRTVKRLGLMIATEKTEIVAFTGRRKRGLIPANIRLGVVCVPIKNCMKYLGLDVDGSWSFREHFKRMATRGEEALASLAGLMPNLRGPHERKRRLYSIVVHSMMLYGAPVWAEALARVSRRNRDLLKRSQRIVAQRVVCAYRTVSGVAAGMLARIPPIDLQAEVLRLVFLKMRQEQTDRGEIDPVAIREYRARVTRDMVDKWKERMKDCRLSGHRVREALGPVLDEWKGGLAALRALRGGGRYRAAYAGKSMPLKKELQFRQLQDPKLKDLSQKLEFKDYDKFELIDGLVFKKGTKKSRFVVPEAMISNIIRYYHDNMAHCELEN
ncbi:reverse transcriptase [Lasius niger]|uniref:Reverse transcriptase n=1 Tax=Lasius niger TaxID=67767 RepID=A0A0J7KSR8_LASNI|nr:reverse transcriptase [Lasius niger]